MAVRRSRRDFDESDVRIRPNKKGTRPRTKDRPDYSEAAHAQVTSVDRGRYGLILEDFHTGDHHFQAMKARELGRKSVVVGDRVQVVGDTSAEPGTLARIVKVLPRASLLRRSADDSDVFERPIVANADQLAVVVALADPPPRTRLIDRCLVAAYDVGLQPLLILTKTDLASPEEFLARYAPLDLPYVVTSTQVREGAVEHDVTPVRSALAGKITVFIGHSGVGKSTLVNALVPHADRSTGDVNDVTGRGRHTSTSAVALPIPGDGAGWVIDTPGVRSFGLGHVDPANLLHAFGDLAPGEAHCPRGCSHDEAECALDAWVAEGHAGPSGEVRLSSLRMLLGSRNEDSED